MPTSQSALRPAVTALFGAGLVLTSLHASAEVSYLSHSSISPITITVIDLTPNDGQAAGFTVGGVENTLSAFGLGHNPASSTYTAGASDSLVLDLGVDYSRNSYGPATGQLGGETAFHGGAPGSDFKQLMGDARQSITYTVLPNTELRFSGTTTLSLGVTGGPIDSYSRADASATIRIQTFYFDSEGRYHLTFNDEFNASRSVSSSDSSLSETQDFQLVFSNPYTSYDTLQFFAAASEAVYFSATAPVPEPATYAMMGAGLFLVGAAARRRRQG